MSKIEPVIYLDLDGVCVDFVSAGLRAHGFDPAQVLERWANGFRGEYRIHKVLGMPSRQYWEGIDRQGEDFWANLEAYPWFWELYNKLSALAPVIFLSASTRLPATLSGKMKWLQARFGPAFQDYVFTFQKQQLASPGALLVDDYDLNIDRFRTAGGSAVCFPQLWNCNHTIADPLAYTLEQARRWRQRLDET